MYSTECVRVRRVQVEGGQTTTGVSKAVSGEDHFSSVALDCRPGREPGPPWWPVARRTDFYLPGERNEQT
jgi:hypothetical protein